MQCCLSTKYLILKIETIIKTREQRVEEGDEGEEGGEGEEGEEERKKN